MVCCEAHPRVAGYLRNAANAVGGTGRAMACLSMACLSRKRSSSGQLGPEQRVPGQRWLAATLQDFLQLGEVGGCCLSELTLDEWRKRACEPRQLQLAGPAKAIGH